MLANIELEKVIITGGYLGAAQATLEEMLAFAKTRHAFKAAASPGPASGSAATPLLMSAGRRDEARNAGQTRDEPDGGGEAGQVRGHAGYRQAARCWLPRQPPRCPWQVCQETGGQIMTSAPLDRHTAVRAMARRAPGQPRRAGGASI
jgi:hypothetical protein